MNDIGQVNNSDLAYAHRARHHHHKKSVPSQKKPAVPPPAAPKTPEAPNKAEPAPGFTFLPAGTTEIEAYSHYSNNKVRIKLSPLQLRKLKEQEILIDAILAGKKIDEKGNPYHVACIFDNITSNFPLIGQYFLDKLPQEVLEIQYGRMRENIRDFVSATAAKELAEYCRINKYPPEMAIILALSIIFAEHTEANDKIAVDGTGIGLFQVGQANLDAYNKIHDDEQPLRNLKEFHVCTKVWFWFINTALTGLYPDKYYEGITNFDETTAAYSLDPNRRMFEFHRDRTGKVWPDKTKEIMSLLDKHPWNEVTDEDCRSALDLALKEYYPDELEALTIYHNAGPVYATRLAVSGYQNRDLDRINYQQASYRIRESKDGKWNYRDENYHDLIILRFVDRFYTHYYVLSHHPYLLEKFYPVDHKKGGPELPTLPPSPLVGLTPTNPDKPIDLYMDPFFLPSSLATHPEAGLSLNTGTATSQAAVQAVPQTKETPLAETPPLTSAGIKSPPEEDTLPKRIQNGMRQTWGNLATAWRHFWASSAPAKPEASAPAGPTLEERKQSFLANFREMSPERKQAEIKKIALVMKIYDGQGQPTLEDYQREIEHFNWLIDEYAADPLYRPITESLITRSRELAISRKARDYTARGYGVDFLGRITDKVQNSPSLSESFKSGLKKQTLDLFRRIQARPGRYSPTDKISDPRSAPILAATYLRTWSTK